MTSIAKTEPVTSPTDVSGPQPDPAWNATITAQAPEAKPSEKATPSTASGTLDYSELNRQSQAGTIDAEADQRERLAVSTANGTTESGYFHGDAKVVGRFNVQVGAFYELHGPSAEASIKADWTSGAGEVGGKVYGHAIKSGTTARFIDNGGSTPGASAPTPGLQSWTAERSDLLGLNNADLRFETGVDRKDGVIEAKVNTVKGASLDLFRHVDTHYARLSINGQRTTEHAMLEGRVDLLNVGYETKHGDGVRSRLKVESGATLMASTTKNITGYESATDTRVVYDPATGTMAEIDLKAGQRSGAPMTYDDATDGGTVHYQTAQTFDAQDGRGRFNVSNIVTDVNASEIVLADDVVGAGAVTVESKAHWHGGGYQAELHNGRVQSLVETGVLGRGTYEFVSPEQAYLQAQRNIEQAGLEGTGVGHMSYERWLDANRQHLVTKHVNGQDVEMIEVTQGAGAAASTGRNLETGLVAVGDTLGEDGNVIQAGGIYAMYDPSAQLNTRMNDKIYVQSNTYGTKYNADATRGSYNLDGSLKVGEVATNSAVDVSNIAGRGMLTTPTAAASAASRITGRTLDEAERAAYATGRLIVPPANAASSPNDVVANENAVPREDTLGKPFHDFSDQANEATLAINDLLGR